MQTYKTPQIKDDNVQILGIMWGKKYPMNVKK